MPSSMGGYPVSRETCGSVCMNAALFRPADDMRSMQLRAMVDHEGACRLPPWVRTHHTLQAPGSLPWASRSLRIRVAAASVSAPHPSVGVLGALEAAARARARLRSSATRRTR